MFCTWGTQYGFQSDCASRDVPMFDHNAFGYPSRSGCEISIGSVSRLNCQESCAVVLISFPQALSQPTRMTWVTRLEATPSMDLELTSS